MLQNARTSLELESGCLQFDALSNTVRQNDVLLYELHAEQSAFDEHLNTEHFIAYDAMVANLVIGKEVRTFNEIMQ